MKSQTKKISLPREFTVFVIIVLVVVITSLMNPDFISLSNLKSIMLSVSTDGLMAIGLTLSLILGGIELSVGAVAAMTSVIVGSLALQGTNIWVACMVALVAGLFVGLFNGYLIAKIGLPPFIVTLGSQELARGVAYIITTGSPLSLSQCLPNGFRNLATGSVAEYIPFLFIIFILVIIVSDVLTKKSNAVRKVFYVGSNESAAKLSGINVNKVKIMTYVAIALLSTLAGILCTARYNVATPELSKGVENTCISAAVIGGTSMMGGAGGIIGTLLGIFLLKIINSALVMLNVSVYWQNFVQGAILIGAVTIDYLSRRKTGTSFLQRMLSRKRKV